MNQDETTNSKIKKMTSCQVFTNNGRFNGVLPPSQQKVQRRVHYSLDKPVYLRAPLCQTARDHPLLAANNKIPSPVNTIPRNKRESIEINIRIPSDSSTDNNNDLTLFSQPTEIKRESVHSQRRSFFIENPSKVTRECSICLFEQSLDQYEEHYSNQCQHYERRICDTCLYNYIKSLLENIFNRNIYCPEVNCISIFPFQSIRYILSRRNNLELFDRYDRQLTHQHLEQIKEFVWCAHNGCDSGQLHDMGERHSNPIIICIKYGKRTCAYHRIIWHTGMTCKEYDQSKVSEQNKTQIWIQKYSKQCPKCKSYIEKVSGCDHMTCIRCSHQFCWECFADYKQIETNGLKQHMEYCSHYPIYYRFRNNSFRQRSRICNIF